MGIARLRSKNILLFLSGKILGFVFFLFFQLFAQESVTNAVGLCHSIFIFNFVIRKSSLYHASIPANGIITTSSEQRRRRPRRRATDGGGICKFNFNRHLGHLRAARALTASSNINRSNLFCGCRTASIRLLTWTTAHNLQRDGWFGRAGLFSTHDSYNSDDL